MIFIIIVQTAVSFLAKIFKIKIKIKIKIILQPYLHLSKWFYVFYYKVHVFRGVSDQI